MADNITDKYIELGSSGLRRNFGQITEEFLPNLQGEKGRKVFKEMAENDPIVGGVLFAIETLIKGVEWRTEPEDESLQEDVEAAEFLETCMNDLNVSWNDFISEILTMLPFGWAYFEKVFKIRNGDNGEVKSKYDDQKIGWRKLALRAQETLYKWEFDESGGIQGLLQRVPFTDYQSSHEPVFIPIEKAILFRTKINKNNPEGRSILRNAYRPWYFKKNIEQTEAIGVERDLAGLPVAKVPPELLYPSRSSEQARVYEEIKKIIQNIRRDEQEGVIFPLSYDSEGRERYKLELLSSAGARQLNTDLIIQRYDKRIAMVALADFILLGHDNVGSFSLSSDKTRLFAAAIGGWLNIIKTTFNKHAVDQLLNINNMKGKALINHGDVETRDLIEIAQYINLLSSAGALSPDQTLEEALRDLAQLPRPDLNSLFPEFGNNTNPNKETEEDEEGGSEEEEEEEEETGNDNN